MLNGMRILMAGNEMRRSPFSIIVLMFCLMLCPLGPAIGATDIAILLLNTEFFFDDKEIHKDLGKNRVFRDMPKLKDLTKSKELMKIQTLMERKEPMKIKELMKIEELTQEKLELIQKDFERCYTDLKKCYEKLYELQAYYIAQLIIECEANIVGLVEIENREVLEKVKSLLPGSEDWKIAFIEGKDNITYQDVAILTKPPVVLKSETDFRKPGEALLLGDKDTYKHPSKILGVELMINNQSFHVIITHFLSRRSNNVNQPDRLKQAIFVRWQALNLMGRETGLDKNVIVMGDMNDIPGEPVIKKLRGLDEHAGQLLQTADAIPDGELKHTYEFTKDNGKVEYQLLDHILLSPSLKDEFSGYDVKGKEQCEIVDVGGLSDHHAIIARLRIE